MRTGVMELFTDAPGGYPVGPRTPVDDLRRAEREAADARKQAHVMGELLIEYHDALDALAREQGNLETPAGRRAVALLSQWPGGRWP